METTQTNNQTSNKSSGLNFVEPKKVVVKDNSEYITLVLPNGMAVRKHFNFFKALMKVPYTPKSSSTEAAA